MSNLLQKSKSVCDFIQGEVSIFPWVNMSSFLPSLQSKRRHKSHDCREHKCEAISMCACLSCALGSWYGLTALVIKIHSVYRFDETQASHMQTSLHTVPLLCVNPELGGPSLGRYGAYSIPVCKVIQKARVIY